MSTRTNVLVTDGTRENTIQLYHHHDGYPKGVGCKLVEYVKKLTKSTKGNTILSTPRTLAEWLCEPQRHDEYELEDFINPHGDIEYLYVIDTTQRTITCCQTLMWCPPAESALCVVDGNLDKALHFGLLFEVSFGQGVRCVKQSLKYNKAVDAKVKHAALQQRIDNGEKMEWLWDVDNY